MNKKYIYSFLLLLLFADLTFSFLQHYNMKLDGDMAGGIVPEEGVKSVLNDPLGISVITENAVYPNPNRFFAHWGFYSYFNTAPIALQAFVEPIESVYLANAIAKTIIQVAFISLLALFITGKFQFLNLNFLIAAILLVPLFQTNGFRSFMGIIDPTATYTFFYALPCVVLLFYYLPFFFESFYQKRILHSWIVKIILFALTFYVVLSSALNPGIILIITSLFGFHNFLQTDSHFSFGKRLIETFRIMPKNHLFFFSFASFLSLYALYIGANNAIFIGETIPISERYARIPKGLFLIFTQKIGFPLLLIAIGINIFLLRKYFLNDNTKKLLHFFNWIGFFAVVYILLLPLGGYKDYRPYIVRYDTILPITLGLFFMYAASSYYLINHLNNKKLKIYLVQAITISVFFTLADKPEFYKNACEKTALKAISEATESVVLIENDCTVLSWSKITDPDNSALNAELLQKWNITKEKKLYFQSE